MLEDQKWLLLRNYDLWSQLTDEEIKELNLVHNFIEAIYASATSTTVAGK